MAQKWSQRFIDNPYNNLQTTDIVAVARGTESGAGQWGELSKIDENTIIIGSNGDAANNGALLTPVLTLAEANTIAGADLTHRWTIICYEKSLNENLALLPNVDYYFDNTEITFSALTFPEWSTVGAAENIFTTVNGLLLNPSVNVTGGFTGTIPGFQWILQLNSCGASPQLDSLSSPKKIAITGFTGASDVAFNKNFKIEINNFNGVPYGQFVGKLYFDFSECLWVQARNSIFWGAVHSYSSGGNTAQTAYYNSCLLTADISFTTTTAVGGQGMNVRLDGYMNDPSGVFPNPKIIINAQHAADYDLTIQASPAFFTNTPDSSGSTTSRWSCLPITDLKGMDNIVTYQLRYVAQGSPYNDSNVWGNLQVGSLGKPYSMAAGVPTAGAGFPISYNLIGEIADSSSAEFNPYVNFLGTGNLWYQSIGTKSINATLWGLLSGAYSRTQFADFSQDSWDLDFSTAGGLPKTLEYYNCAFASASGTGGPYTITATSTSELFNFNNCIGGVYSFNYNGQFILKGGTHSWNGGTLPSLDLQARNANGSQIVLINGASLNNSTTIDVTNDSKADSTVFIENSSVKQAQWTFTGTVGGTMSVFTNCLDPANVTVAGSSVSISPTGNAQCIKVNFSPTGYTVATPPTGWLAAAEQHFQGISTKLDAYSYSGTDTTFGNGNILVQRSASGGNVGVFTNNLSNTASSDAFQTVGVAGSSAGDAYTAWGVSGGGQFAMGIDNSDSDKFKRTAASDLNSNIYEVVTSAGEITHPLQPAFLAYLATTQTNKTGNGATYQLGTDALTEVFDQNSDFNTNGTFTAPVTGRYMFAIGVRVTNTTIAANLNLNIVTSNRTAQYLFSRAAGNPAITGHITFLTDMDAADTLIANVITTGEAADTNSIFGSGNVITYMSGYLAA